MNYNDFPDMILQRCKLEKFDVNTTAMILGQCEWESVGFTQLEESFKYSPEQLLKTFPSYFRTINFARAVAKMGAEAIANLVYENRMGNGSRNSGDGWKFRGRGLIQLTGKNNYAEIGKALDIELVKQPELAIIPANAAAIAITYFKRRPWLMKAASDGDVLAASSWINLGHYKPGSSVLPHGLAARKANFTRWLKKLKAQAEE